MNTITTLESAVDKAKAAVAAAKEAVSDVELDSSGLMPLQVDHEFRNLLAIANTHAAIAQAEALEAIAAAITKFCSAPNDTSDKEIQHG